MKAKSRKEYKYYTDDELGKRIIPYSTDDMNDDRFPFFQEQKALNCGKHAIAHILYDPNENDKNNEAMLKQLAFEFQNTLKTSGQVDIELSEIPNLFQAITQKNYKVVVTGDKKILTMLNISSDDKALIQMIHEQADNIETNFDLGYIFNSGNHWLALRKLTKGKFDYWYLIDSLVPNSVYPAQIVDRNDHESQQQFDIFLNENIKRYRKEAALFEFLHVFKLPPDIEKTYDKKSKKVRIVMKGRAIHMNTFKKNKQNRNPRETREANLGVLKEDYDRWKNQSIADLKFFLLSQIIDDFHVSNIQIPPDFEVSFSALNAKSDDMTVADALKESRIQPQGNEYLMLYDTNMNVN